MATNYCQHRARNATPTRRAAAGILMLAVAAQAPSTAADWAPRSLRVQYALNEFRDTTSVNFAWELAEQWIFRRAHRMEVDAGVIHAPGEVGVIVSLGPVWRFPFGQSRYFADFGIAPALVSRREFGGTDIGGHFHFTTSFALGTRLGANGRFSLGLRITHTSNASLDKPNPGLDMVGLVLSTTGPPASSQGSLFRSTTGCRRRASRPCLSAMRPATDESRNAPARLGQTGFADFL